MSEQYRIICRHLTGKNKVRALLLRDPTPSGDNHPAPFLPGDSTKARPHQWLPDAQYALVLPDNDVFNGVNFERVKVNKNNNPAMFQVESGNSFRNVQIPLFQPFRDIVSSETSEEDIVHATAAFSAEAKGMVESSADESKEEVDLGCPGIAALLEVFWSDEELDVLAQMGLELGGQPGVITMAVLSGFVIDLDSMPSEHIADMEGSLTFYDVEKRTVTFRLIVPDNVPPLTLPLKLHQTAAGCHISVDWDLMLKPAAGSQRLVDHWFYYNSPEKHLVDFQVNRSELEDATLVLFRSVGPVASGGEQRVGRFPVTAKIKHPAETKSELQESPSLVFDALGAQRFVGERLHYRLELRNAVDAVVASGYIADQRLRLDHPSPPPYAEALIDKDNSLSIRLEYPDEYANLEPVVWYQRRLLDPCGYYGTDDDMALEEGLRQADMNYSGQVAEFVVEGDWADTPAFQALQGKYAKYGLHKLLLEGGIDEGFFESAENPTDTALNAKGRWLIIDSHSETPSRRRRVITKLALPKDEDKDNGGYRFYVGWRRTNGGDAPPESKLKLCTHFLQQGASEGEASEQEQLRRVFQLETLPKQPAEPAREWLKQCDITLMLCDGARVFSQPNEILRQPNDNERERKANPYRVRISMHASEHTKGTLGGLRIYARDILGPKDTAPFRLVGEYEIVSSSVYRYRPYRLDHSRKLLSPADITANWCYPTTGKSREDADSWFKDLAQKLENPGLRNKLGHLVVDPGKIAAGDTATNHDRPKAQPLVYSRVLIEQLQAVLQEHQIDWGKLADGLKSVEQDKRDKVNKVFRSSWDLLGPFLQWAVAAGFARDLILPYAVSRRKELDDWFAKLKSEHPPRETSVRLFAVSFAQPAAQALLPDEHAELVMATVRILLIPAVAEWPEITGSDSESAMLKKALELALHGATGGDGEMRVFRESQSDPDYLVVDTRGWASLEWDGIGDTWHHRLEFAIQKMDRYRMARKFFNPESDSSIDPSAEVALSNVAEGVRKAVEVSRREPPPGPPGIMAITEPYRIGFRILETEQREAAAYNALAQMRYGDIALMTRLTASFPWSDRYAQEFAELTKSNKEVAREQTPTAENWQIWNGSDIIEERHAPFFLIFTREVRWKADNLLGEVASASWQRQPSCLSLAGNPKVSINDNQLIFTVPIVRLWDLLTEEEKQHPLAELKLVNECSALHLPDLETTYSLLHRVNEQSPYRKVLTLVPPELKTLSNTPEKNFGYKLTPQDQRILSITESNQWHIVVEGVEGDFIHNDWKWVISRNELNIIVEVSDALQ